MLARKTRGIERVNAHGQKLRIKTAANRFKLISISRYAPIVVMVFGTVITFANQMTVLGLTLKRTGISCHVRTELTLQERNGQG